MAQVNQIQLAQASARYLEDLSNRNHESVQQELARFVRWCGRERTAQSLTPTEVEGYSSTLEAVGDDRSQRLGITRKFLTYLHDQGWTSTNLAPHARLRRTGRKAPRQQSKQPQAQQLTADGHQRLQEELAALKAQRITVAEDIRLAAATKDFTENAPLDAAREQQGQMEARIRELEAILKDATILGVAPVQEDAGSRIAVGSSVVLRHTQTGQKVTYLLVESSEADPTAGKISAASPVGKAVLDRAVGDEVDVVTPRGTVRYLVTKVGS